MLEGKPSGILGRGAQRNPFFVPHPMVYTTSVRDQIRGAAKGVTRFDLHRAMEWYRKKVRKGLEKKLRKSYVGRKRVNATVRDNWNVEKVKIRAASVKWKKGEEEKKKKKKAAAKKKVEAGKKSQAKAKVAPKAKKLGQRYGAGLKILAQTAPAAKPAAKKPVAATPAAKKPVAATPAAKKPVAATPAAKKPVAATPGSKIPPKKLVSRSGSGSDVKPKVVNPEIKAANSKFGTKLKPSQVNANFKVAIKKKLHTYNKLGTTIPHE
jgi:hypothetical protein